MLLLKLLSAFALIGSIIWCVAAPGYEPAIAILTSLSSLVGTLIADRKSRQQALQNQTVQENGFGIQAGGNVTTGEIKVVRGNSDAK